MPTYLGRSKDKEMVAFHRDCAHSCDVEDFESLVRDATSQTPLPTLEQAFKLYQGQFLAGFSLPDAPDFDRWVEAKRQELTGAYHKLLHLLSLRYLTTGDWPKAITCLEHLRRGLVDIGEALENRDGEVVYGLLMICHALTSRLDLAAGVYREYEQQAPIAARGSATTSTLDKLHKIIQTYHPSNVRARALVAETLRRINHGTLEPRLEDALLSVYTATGARRVPKQGPRYRAMLHRAQAAAARHGASLIGTPHLLLALCAGTDETPPDIRQALPISLESMAQAVQTVLGEAGPATQMPSELTLSLQRVLQVAADIAGTAQADAVDIPHLWLALLREKDGLFSRLLAQWGMAPVEIIEQMDDERE